MQTPRTPIVEPEILSPRSQRGADLLNDKNLDYLSHILDDFLRIPGTQIRFGLDGIIGLVPGIGDILGAMASWIIILAAWLRGVPKVTLARMLTNVAIETVIGTVPIAGDIFDIAWKANRRNYALLERSTQAPAAPMRRSHTASDWLFLIGLTLGMMALLAIPLMLLAWLLGHFFAMGARH